MRNVIATLLALAVAAALAGAAVVYGGLYDVSATTQHLAPTYRIIDVALRRAVTQRAKDIKTPDLDRQAVIGRGLALYRDNCVPCHGAPGIPPQPFALGLRPAPANLVHTGREWTEAEVFWTVKHGIKMTGMPAWEYRLPDADLWAVTAFVMKLPELSPGEYRALASSVTPAAEAPEPPLRPPDPERGKAAMLNYACITCHRIPGVVGPDAPVGPPLDGMGARTFIAGVLPNEPGMMERWLRSPQRAAPLSAMPDLGVGEQDARDMAAYLATLK